MELTELTILEKIRKRIDNTTDLSSEISTPSYVYDILNKNIESNTTVLLSPHFDTSIQPRHISASYAFLDSKYLASYGFY